MDILPFESRLLPFGVKRRLAYYPRALRAVDYARTNFVRAVRLNEVAGEVGMTPRAFSRYFARKIGMTFCELLKVLRIERALKQIELRDGSIAMLAEHAGYESSCAFTRAFKAIVGHTPSEYRRRVVLRLPERDAA